MSVDLVQRLRDGHIRFGSESEKEAALRRLKERAEAADLIERYEQALRFYTNDENWRLNGQLDPNSGNFTGGPARALVEGKGNE